MMTMMKSKTTNNCGRRLGCVARKGSQCATEGSHSGPPAVRWTALMHPGFLVR